MSGIGLSKYRLEQIARAYRELPDVIFAPAQTPEESSEKGRALTAWVIETIAALIEENNDQLDRDFDERVGRAVI